MGKHLMSTWKCLSCGATYSDTSPGGYAFYHACPTEKVTPGVFDARGNLVTPEKREPFPNRRDENVTPGLEWFHETGGPPKCMKQVPHPEERGRFIFVETQPTIVSEGAGRELVT